MASKTMLFGPIGQQVTVPWPESGMGMDFNLNTETTDLLNGEQSIWRAPLSYRSFNMSWSGGSEQLQPLIDVYQGMYGQGPYYIADPVATIQGNNMLPAKWASPFMLAHVANGWGAPVVTPQTTSPELQQVTFSGLSGDSDLAPFSAVVPCVPAQPMYFAVWGTTGGTASASVRVYRYSKSARTWSHFASVGPTLSNDAPTLVRSQAEADAGDIVAVKIVPYVENGAGMSLRHMDLAVNDYRSYVPYMYGRTPGLAPSYALLPGMTLFPSSTHSALEGTGTVFRSGKGIGPVQFTGNVGGKLDSATTDRIGLSFDLCEVSRDPKN